MRRCGCAKNAGKQKEDTKSEEDSETPVQEIPDVEVTVSGEDADAHSHPRSRSHRDTPRSGHLPGERRLVKL